MFRLWIFPLLLCGVSCVRLPPEPVTPQPEQDLLQPSIALGESLLHAISEKDFQQVSKLLAGRVSHHITIHDFESSCRSMEHHFGKIRNYSFVMELETPLVKNLIYKVLFIRKNSGGTEIRREILFRIVTARNGDDLKVLGMGFF